MNRTPTTGEQPYWDFIVNNWDAGWDIQSFGYRHFFLVLAAKDLLKNG